MARFWCVCVAAAVVAACSPRATVTAPSTPATSAVPVSPPVAPAPATAHARWLPHVAPTFDFPIPSPGKQHVFGPASTNFLTPTTAYLGKDRVGMIVGGRRFIYEQGALRKIEAGDDGDGLIAVRAIASALGGGFVFIDGATTFYAESFDAPLHRIASGTGFTVGPHCILGEDNSLVSIPDGKPIKAQVEHLAVQAKSGFAVVTTDKHAWITTDGHTLKPIKLGPFHQSAPDGDALLLVGEKSAERVTRAGAVTAVKIDEAREKQLQHQLVSENPALEDAYPGALLDGGFTITGRPDEWYAVRADHRIWRTNVRTRETSIIGKPVGDDTSYCSGGLLDDAPHVFCMQLGKSMRIYTLDLESGATTLVATWESKNDTTATFMGAAANVYPRSIMVAAACAGDSAADKSCVLDARGNWHDFARPATGKIMPFPGELLAMGSTPDDGIELKNLATGAHRTYSGAEVAPLFAALGIDPKQKPTVLSFKMVDAGMLRIPDGIRAFEIPNPFTPTAPKAESAYVDYTFNPHTPLTITKVDGVVAPAGLHGLRLSGGKLWETSDGWTTWNAVEPPPTGVPADLAGASCSEVGCVLGPWVRIGWDR